MLSNDELDPCPGTDGGLANLGVPDRREACAGRISADGARNFDGGELACCR